MPARTRPPQDATMAEVYDDGEPFIADELVIEVARSATPEAIDALTKRYSVALVEQLDSELGNTIAIRARSLDQRPVEAEGQPGAAHRRARRAPPRHGVRPRRP